MERHGHLFKADDYKPAMDEIARVVGARPQVLETSQNRLQIVKSYIP